MENRAIMGANLSALCAEYTTIKATRLFSVPRGYCYRPCVNGLVVVNGELFAYNKRKRRFYAVSALSDFDFWRLARRVYHSSVDTMVDEMVAE